MRLTREPVDGEWLDERLDTLERLVAEGDGLAAVRVLAETTRAARRAGGPAAVLADGSALEPS